MRGSSSTTRICFTSGLRTGRRRLTLTRMGAAMPFVEHGWHPAMVVVPPAVPASPPPEQAPQEDQPEHDEEQRCKREEPEPAVPWPVPVPDGQRSARPLGGSESRTLCHAARQPQVVGVDPGHAERRDEKQSNHPPKSATHGNPP